MTIFVNKGQQKPQHMLRKTVSWKAHSQNKILIVFNSLLFQKKTVCNTRSGTTSNPCLNLNCGGHILLVNSPDSRKINGLVPCIQNGYHLAYAPEIAFEDRLEVVTTTAGFFNNDSELIVDEETHEKVARTNHPKYLQSTAHLGIFQDPAIASTPIG